MDDKVLQRVRNLLARAEHPNTPEAEAELALQQAHRMMAKHAIDLATARHTQTRAQREKPVRRKVTTGEAEFWPLMMTMLIEIARTNRVETVSDGQGGMWLLGFNDDVVWTEMMYTSSYETFVNRLRPRWNSSKGYDENVYNFKVAGYRWADINTIALENGEMDARVYKPAVVGWDENYKPVYEPRPTDKISSRMITAYRRHARRIGDTEPVATQTFEAYRLSYASAFVTRVNARLEEMRRQGKEEVEAVGAEMVIRDAHNDVLQFMYDEFPFTRPRTPEEIAEMRARVAAQNEREQEARRQMLDGMTDAQRRKFLEKEENERRRRARESDRYWREQDRLYDPQGALRGRSAADSVNLTRTSRVDTQERSQIDG